MKYKIISAVSVGLLAAGMLYTGMTQSIFAGQEGMQASGAANQEASADVARSVSTTTLQDEMTALAAPASASVLESGLSVSAGDVDETMLTGTESDAESANPAEVSNLSEGGTAEEENEYADLAIANVDNYVNVRSEANTDSAIVGKIYSGAVAQILEVSGEENDWFKIVSGNAEGYIKAEYFIYGEEAAAVIDHYVTRYAVVQADRLNVRENPDLEARRIGFVNSGEKVVMLENQGDWIQVQYTGSKIGYVAAEYVTITEEFVYAKTLEEEAAELAARKALEDRQHVSETSAAENVTITVTPPSGDYSTNSELRSEIIEYAMRFLGNKYVHGGNSLETGTDCSGFTSLIYAQFGYSISRTPGGQLSGDGRSIDYSEIQLGDIICYGSSGKCTHVALYMGDGQIIHSANSRKGVVIYEADYDTILGVKNIID